MDSPTQSYITEDLPDVVQQNVPLILIENLMLDEETSTYLGDTQTAREDQGIGDLKIGRTTLDGLFKEILYGQYKSYTACRFIIEFTIKSDTDFRVSAADLRCTLGNEIEASQPLSSDVVRPSILRRAPRELNDENPTEVGVTATISVMPNIEVPDVVTISGLGFTTQKTYTQVWGWHLHSSIWSSKGRTATTRDSASWNFTSNRVQKDSRLHTFSTEVLACHNGKPFYADFEIEASLSFGAAVRTIGKETRIRTRRWFFPTLSSIVFT